MAGLCDRGAYRDAHAELVRACGQLRGRRARECEALGAHAAVIRRRVGRIFAGFTLAAGAAGVMGAGAALTVTGSIFRVGDAAVSSLGAAMIAVWLLGVAAYGVGMHFGGVLARDTVRSYLGTTSDLLADLERLRKVEPAGYLLATAQRLEKPAMDWFMVGTALALPLLLHGVVWLVGSGFSPALHDFGVWIALSSVLVGHCHLVFAHRAFGFGRALLDRTRHMPREPVVATVGACMGASLVPGLVLVALPTVLVGLTAAVATPLLYGAAGRFVTRERDLLSLDLPVSARA